MQQRQLRLGDTLDDYCPRERRVTNHVIVAMIEQDIKQTRCTTCEAEHEYKHAKVPPQRRKKAEPGTLYKDVLAGLPRKPLPVAPGNGTPVGPDPAPLPALEPDVAQAAASATDVSADDRADEADAPPAVDADETPEVEGPVHRPLIRATLPRPEGQPPARPIPEFTARQAATRPGRRPPGGRGPRGAPHGVGSPGQGLGSGRGHGGRRGQGVSAAGGPHGGRARSPHQGQGHPQGQGGQRRRGGKKRFK
jgi:hypothetical protein